MMVSKDTAEHYTWAEVCDGWILAGGQDLLIIEERMPPGTRETRHLHARARQFFYVLSGALTMERGGEVFHVPARHGIEIPPDIPHQARNEGGEDLAFLVISAPTSRGDRIAAPGL